MNNTITVETHHSCDNIALNFDTTRNVWILQQAPFNAPAGAAIEEIHIDLVPEERHRGYVLRLTPHKPVEPTKGGTIHNLRIDKKELYLGSDPHPAWILEPHPQQGWAWREQRRERHDRSPVESKESIDCHGFLIETEADPTVLWEKVHKYTSQSNFVEELSVLDQHKWHEWNLNLPLRAAVLLGAGASYPLGIPTGGQLLDSLFAHLRATSGLEEAYTIAKAVRNKERRRRQWRGNKDVSAEELVAGLEMRVSPGRRRLTPRASSDEYLQDLKYSEEAYIHAIDTLVRLLLDVMRIVDKHKLWYLLPLVGAGKERPLTIASLNYDLAVEYACDIANVPCSTGIECWERNGEFPKPSTGVDLLKLHGSINWEYRQSVWRRGSIPEDKVLAKPTRKVIEPAFPDIVPAVIFGSGNKLTATGPFLSLLATFAQRLELGRK
jgi:hypothetical protein